jgi:hypothetical protein
MRDTTVVGSGPAGQSVTLNLALGFKPRTAGRSFTIEVAAAGDLGESEEFRKAGAVNVRLKEKP